MIVLFLKSQAGLFEKIVPVAGSVHKDGTITKPHFATRYVKPRTTKPAPVVHDLFAAPAEYKQAAKVKPAKPERALGDLFDMPAAKPAAKPDIFAETAAKVRARKETAARLAAEGRPVKLRHTDGRTALAGPDVSKPGAFRHTRFDAKGPLGHTEHASLHDAIHGALTGGFEPVEEPNSPVPERRDSEGPAAGFDPAMVPAFGVPAGTSKETRRRINAEAVALIDSKSDFTEADRAILRQYSGTGGVGDSLNEFYTDPKVAAAMWATLRTMGVRDDAEVLEPSAATGVFLATAPAGVKIQGVELDPTSARIGEILHPTQAMENASLERFAVRDTRQFDAVIGNVPFGLRGSLIKDDKPNLKTAESYFLDTSLDKTRPGGLVALIVPTGVMDGRNTRALRERLLRKGEFLGAIRMPNTAFEHSHTGVTTDIVYFRKRPDDVAAALMTVNQDALKALGLWDDEFMAGEYFTGRGAENVLGTMTAGWRAKAGFGDDITVEGDMLGVPEEIAKFKPEPAPASPTLEMVLGALDDPKDKARASSAAMRRPYDNAKPGDTKIIDGIEYVLQGRPPRWHRVDEFMQLPAVTDAQALAADIDSKMRGEDIEGLAERVRAYVEKHGNPSKNADLELAARTDKSIYRLIGAVGKDGELSDVVADRKAAPTESTFEAAALSLAMERGDFTPEQVAARWHQGDAETALDHLYASNDFALNVDGTWASLDNYLSGELWPKLDAAKAALAGDVAAEDRSQFERQARLLEEAIDPKSLEDVEVMLNSAFLPLHVVAAFFNDQKAKLAANGNSWASSQPDMTIKFDKGVYTVTGGLYDASLLDKYLNRTGVRKDDLPKIDQWNTQFKAWLTASQYRDEVEELYNRKFRGFRQRGYSDKAFEIPGLNPEMVPNNYQWAGLRWALEAGKGIIAADVGLGKTPRGLMLAKLAKATGKAKKPTLVVPKSVLANWVAEMERWFPGSRFLTIGETYTRDENGVLRGKQDTAADRNRKYHELTQNDYDFVFISQPAWNDLDLDPITKGQYANDDFWVQRGDSLGNAGDKRVRKIREAHEQALAGREFKKRSDAIYFNDLGIDMVIADEFHAFKNLYAAKNRFGESPKFLGGQGLSNRALDMSYKARWVRERNGGGNVFGLTATPTKNSPLEIYSMLSYIAPEAFEKIGVRNSEEFLDRFCVFETQNVLGTNGEIDEALVTAGFKNLDELREIMRRYIDRKTAADVGLKLPTHDARQHLVDMSAEQQAVYGELRELAAKSAGDRDATGDAHIFSIMDKMGKAALDLELYDPVKYAGAKSPKYAAAAEQVVEGIKDGGQIMFSEAVNSHQKMVDALVAAGVPRDQIAIINAQEAETSSRRQNIADAFNAGTLKVVIGNKVMEEGMNLQKGTADIHHLDLPWEPATVQQRNGRGLRQGNKMSSVRVHTYLSKGSFDGYRYQSVLAKKDWQDLLWNGGNRVENLAAAGNVSRDDMMIMLAADPDAARKQYSENRAAAQERFEAAQRTGAASEFARYQEMKVSFASLKQKNSTSGERLRVKIDRAKAALAANPHFHAKAALNSSAPVVIQPDTGRAYHEGVGFDVEDTPDAPAKGGGKFVVTSVSPDHDTVYARRWGSTSPYAQGFKLSDLKRVRPMEHSAADEQAHIARELEEAAKNKVSTIAGMKDLAALPHSVIEANYAALQKQIREGTANYRFDHGHGHVGVIDAAGRAHAAASYEAKDHAKDNRDFLLPIPAHRELALAGHVEAERDRKFGRDHHTGRRGKSTSNFAVKYRNKFGHGESANPFTSIGRNLFGDTFAHEARARLLSEQGSRARQAKTLPDALAHLAPTIDVAAYGGGIKWPKRSLAILWAKAKQLGKLDAPFDKELPTAEEYGRARPTMPADVFPTRRYGRAEPINLTKPTREVLIELAKGAGHDDLAAAMVVSSLGKGDADGAVKELLDMPQTGPVRDSLHHLIAKRPELASRRASEFTEIRAGQRPYDVYGGGASPGHPLYEAHGASARDMTLSDLVNAESKQ